MKKALFLALFLVVSMRATDGCGVEVQTTTDGGQTIDVPIKNITVPRVAPMFIDIFTI